MANSPNTELPSHLADLMRPTPSAVAQLIAAWDGLHAETQMLLLNRDSPNGSLGLLMMVAQGALDKKSRAGSAQMRGFATGVGSKASSSL